MPRFRRTAENGRYRPRVIPEKRAAAARQLREQATRRAKVARIQLLLATPVVVAVFLAYKYRVELFGLDEPIRIVAAFVLAALGWWVARAVGQLIAPSVSKRIDVSNAGTLGFLIRLVLLGVTLLVALRIAGLEARSLAVGGAFTAVILGLAAQNTLGNVLSGLMLISARPFKIGERVRLQAGALAGQVEGTATGFGLLYVTFARGDDTILVPNSTVLMSAIVPLKEPAAVDLRAGGAAADLPRVRHERCKGVPDRLRVHIGQVDVVVAAVEPEPDRLRCLAAVEVVNEYGGGVCRH